MPLTWHYSVCGLVIESDQPIQELRPHPPGSPDLVVRWNVDQLPASTQNWFRQWPLTGRPWLRFARTEGGYLLRFGDWADFWVSASGSLVLCRPDPATPDHTVKHMFLDQTLPLLLSRRGSAVFHASAVQTEHGAVVFSGPSGRGKSTLAGYFAGLGYPLITDDCLAVRIAGDSFTVLPAYPGVRLWQDSLQFLAPQAHDLPAVSHDKDKRRYAPEETLPFTGDPVPLRRFYFLEPAYNTELEIAPVTGAALIRAVVGSQFLLDTEDPGELESGFRIATGLARSGLCYRLAVPRDLTLLADCARRIASHAAAGLLSEERSSS
ncbi:MAG: hypothetical protein JNN08_26090 [Bryobacterales bacterium]|nr:hypothetical protein [Bryobacterales bacterium]